MLLAWMNYLMVCCYHCIRSASEACLRMGKKRKMLKCTAAVTQNSD